MFQDFSEVHKSKDVGRIVHYVQGKSDWSTKILMGDSSDVNDFGDVEIVKIPRRNFQSQAIIWILKNAKSLHVLQLFHYSKFSVLAAVVYRIANRKGKVYLKMDADQRNLDKWRENSRNPLRRLYYRLTWKAFDLVSIETKSMFNELNQMWTFLGSRLLYVPNVVAGTAPPLPNEVQKVFLFVGRVGAYQKATDVLVKAFVQVCERMRFDLHLVGPVEAQFGAWLDDFLNKIGATHCKGRIKFVGNVSGRAELERIYANSAVFVFPSRWESFGLAVLEAAHQGCFIIATPTGVSKEIIDATQYGISVPIDDPGALATALLECESLGFHYGERREASEKISVQYSEEEHYGRLLARLRDGS